MTTSGNRSPQSRSPIHKQTEVTQAKIAPHSQGIQDKIKPIFDCPPVRTYVQAVNDGKCSFPALEIEDGKSVMLESADIIAFLTEKYQVESERLWASRYFDEGLLVTFRALFGYLVQQEGGYPNAAQWFAENAELVPHPCPPEGAAEVL